MTRRIIYPFLGAFDEQLEEVEHSGIEKSKRIVAEEGLENISFSDNKPEDSMPLETLKLHQITDRNLSKYGKVVICPEDNGKVKIYRSIIDLMSK